MAAKILGSKNRIVTNKKVTIRVPIKMLEDISQHLAKQNISIKKRSEWICKAIEDLHKSEDYSEIVCEEWIEAGNNILLQVNLDNRALAALEEMKTNLKLLAIDNPQVKDEISCIIRTAILQRLICNK